MLPSNLNVMLSLILNERLTGSIHFEANASMLKWKRGPNSPFSPIQISFK